MSSVINNIKKQIPLPIQATVSAAVQGRPAPIHLLLPVAAASNCKRMPTCVHAAFPFFLAPPRRASHYVPWSPPSRQRACWFFRGRRQAQPVQGHTDYTHIRLGGRHLVSRRRRLARRCRANKVKISRYAKISLEFFPG